MYIIAFIGCGLIGAALCVVLNNYRPEFKMTVSLVTGIIMLAAIVLALKPVIDMIGELSVLSGVDSIYIDVLIKALAICYITQLACETCRDSGEASIASKIELAGKCAVLVLSVPVITKLIDFIKGLLFS